MARKKYVVTETQVVDPTMDPASERWNPVRYFRAQPEVEVFVKRDESDQIKDPDGRIDVTHTEGINGYLIQMVMGQRKTLPLDFAIQMIDRRKAEPIDWGQYDRLKAERFNKEN